MTTPDPRTLNAPDLVAFAKSLLAKGRAHWTIASIALGRIVDERLYERTEFGAATSDEAWAKEKLGMTRGELRLALKLWRAMEKYPAVPWSSLNKPRALLLTEVLAAGGDVTEWGARARNAKSTSAFEREVRSRLGDAAEGFTTLKLRIPDSMTELVDEAFSKAALVAMSDDLSPGQGNGAPPPPEGAQNVTEGPAKVSWRDPAVGFRALELLCLEYLAGTVRT